MTEIDLLIAQAQWNACLAYCRDEVSREAYALFLWETSGETI